MIVDIVMLLLSLGIILLACAVFVNAVECLGKALNLHQGIIGSILAAIGTALPETIIPIIAIVFTKGPDAHDIGIGAIMGAPFMLGTLAFFVTGTAVVVNAMLGKRTIHMKIDSRIMSKDLTFFLIIYGSAVSTTCVHDIFWAKVIVAISLFLSYGIYLRMIIKGDAEMIENVDALYLHKFLKFPDNTFSIVIQVLLALACIIFGAQLFIKYVQGLSLAIGVPTLILSLIITPIATELPEKLNSIIWVGRKKDTLALGNITGAMVFQSCVPVVFGMIFTHWELTGVTLISAILALSSGLITLLWLKIFKSLNPFILMAGGVCYGVLLWYVSTVIGK
jgi:cation:H+ antiporter